METETETKQEEQKVPEGFITKEEWVAKGRDPEQWRDPEEFKRRGEEILPIVKSKLDKTSEELALLKEDMKRIVDFNERQEKKIREDERRKILAEYEKKKKAAVEDGDFEALNRAEQEKEQKTKELDDNVSAPANTNQGDNWDATFTDWKSRNKWYEDDADLRKWADEDGKGILNMKIASGMTPEKALDYVADTAKKLHPERFTNAQRENAASVETEGSIRTPDSTKMVKISDIPDKDERDKARASYKRVKETLKMKGRDYTEKEYMESYTS